MGATWWERRAFKSSDLGAAGVVGVCEAEKGRKEQPRQMAWHRTEV